MVPTNSGGGDIHASAIEPDSRFPLFLIVIQPGTKKFESEQARLRKAFDTERAKLAEFEFRR